MENSKASKWIDKTTQFFEIVCMYLYRYVTYDIDEKDNTSCT